MYPCGTFINTKPTTSHGPWCHKGIYSMSWIITLKLTHHGLVTPGSHTDLGQHWFGQWPVCQMTPSHQLNQCWLLISEVVWPSAESNFAASAQATIQYNEFENYIQKWLSPLQGPMSWVVSCSNYQPGEREHFSEKFIADWNDWQKNW